MSSLNGLDLNQAVPQESVTFFDQPEQRLGVEMLKQRLYTNLLQVLIYLFPSGKTQGHHFVIGNVQGDPGDSLKVETMGPKIGLWHDFTTNEGGDILSLWAAAKGFDISSEFPELISSIYAWLGTPLSLPSQKPSQKPTESELFPSLAASAVSKPSTKDLSNPTASWYYKDGEGNLLVRVRRYDTETGKEFRPWDYQSQSYKVSTPRPLYNQPGMAKSDTVILVEGEKCAQALIDLGICATTAMNGAKAPLDKTDWSPLQGKHVILWPDHDEVGQEYANALAKKLPTLGVASLSRVEIPADKPQSWDAADAYAEGMDIEAFLKTHVYPIEDSILETVVDPAPQDPGVLAFKAGHLFDDKNPLPDDWIAPRILTPGGLLVFGGAPKVGKTDLMLNWLCHLSAGVPFLGMTPPRPLKIFYLQTEIMYDYLRERLQNLVIDPKHLPLVRENLVLTPQLRMLLNEDGVTKVYNTIIRFFDPQEVDVLVIDPLRNVYDAGKSGSENDNLAMLAFLQDRVEKLRALLNPKAGVILTHHTKKVTKSMVEDDPFQALSGAASLRSFYTTGMMLFKPDEKQSLRHLMFELRNGQSIATKHVDKIEGQWQERTIPSERIVRKDYGEKLDAELRRRHDVIVQLIFDKAKEGKIYTPTQFCETFEGQAGLGGDRTIRRRLSVLATKGYIKFNMEEDYRVARSKCGVMCVEGMQVPVGSETMDPETGEMLPAMVPLLPTHFKESQSGAILPVENPEVWVYLD